jgi:hypothetical protein
MINFKIISVDSALLALEKSGKPLQFKIGEVINADVLENLSSGSIALKIKGSVITAQSSIPMEKDTVAYFKVTSLPVDGQQLTLKYLGSEPKPPVLAADPKAQSLGSLMKSLTAAIASGGGKVDSALIQSLLKSLPADAAEIPQNVRIQLQSLLSDSLKSTGQSISSRLGAILGPLVPEGDADAMVPLQNRLMLDVERLVGSSLKTSLANTGVAFEAKLRAEALTSLLGAAAEESAGTATPAVRHDLKALLLGIKAAMDAGEIDGSVKAPTNHQAESTRAATQPTLAQQVDGLLKDVETFQLLSKTTESFYTFLPINWQQLRDADIAFKQGGGGGMRGRLYSCRINLDLDPDGRVSVMIMKNGPDYTVSVWAERSALKARMAEHSDELKDAFRQSGLSLVAVNLLDSREAIQEQFDHIESPATMVNVQA